MATAGAVLDPRDPIIDEVRSLMGFSPQPEDLLDEYEEDKDAARELAASEADAASAIQTNPNDPDINNEQEEDDNA